MPTSRILIFAALALGALALLSACTPANPQPVGLTPIPTLAGPQNPVPVTAQPGGGATGPVQTDAAMGSAVFELNCTPCHGVNGEGVSGPALRNNKFIEGDVAQVVDTIAHGRISGGMPAWLMADGGPLTASQAASVAAFIRTWQNVPAMPTATPMPPEPTEPPPPPDAEPAKPSDEGGPGEAVNLTGDATRGQPLFGQYCAVCHGPQGVLGQPNPESDDAFVPGLNPIDETMVSSDPKVFATNVDLFLEHGSVPAGTNPKIRMPAFGDLKLLQPQQLADIIAYVIQLNR